MRINGRYLLSRVGGKTTVVTVESWNRAWFDHSISIAWMFGGKPVIIPPNRSVGPGHHPLNPISTSMDLPYIGKKRNWVPQPVWRGNYVGANNSRNNCNGFWRSRWVTYEEREAVKGSWHVETAQTSVTTHASLFLFLKTPLFFFFFFFRPSPDHSFGPFKPWRGDEMGFSSRPVQEHRNRDFGYVIFNTTAPHISPWDTGGMFSSILYK